MKTYRTYIVAAVAAALAATAIARLHRNDAEMPKPAVHAGQSHQGSGESNLLNLLPAYLPDLFIQEEWAAPVEPLPPQF